MRLANLHQRGDAMLPFIFGTGMAEFFQHRRRQFGKRRIAQGQRLDRLDQAPLADAGGPGSIRRGEDRSPQGHSHGGDRAATAALRSEDQMDRRRRQCVGRPLVWLS